MEIEYLKSGVSNEILSIFVAKLPEIKVEGLKKRWKTWVAKDTINIKKRGSTPIFFGPSTLTSNNFGSP